MNTNGPVFKKSLRALPHSPLLSPAPLRCQVLLLRESLMEHWRSILAVFAEHSQLHRTCIASMHPMEIRRTSLRRFAASTISQYLKSCRHASFFAINAVEPDHVVTASTCRFFAGVPILAGRRPPSLEV